MNYFSSLWKSLQYSSEVLLPEKNLETKKKIWTVFVENWNKANILLSYVVKKDGAETQSFYRDFWLTENPKALGRSVSRVSYIGVN